jgi:hypothetical protein
MTRTCPRCEGTELYEIDQVCMEATDSVNGILDVALFAYYGPSGEMGWFGEKDRRVAVNASARVCGTCGHADLFTRNTELLKKLAEKGVRGIRRL